MKRTVLSLILLLAPLSIASAAGALEGPTMTAARQLDLAAHHLAATAQQQARDGRMSTQAAETAIGFAELVRDFRFELEPSLLSAMQAEVRWAQVVDGFAATRDLLHGSDSRELQHEVLRLNALMNRLDRSFGGTGFWSGRTGWSG